ncbi:DUF2064 domain-containing protein [Flavobacteriaceae bacterium R38]|nr:DUF2064 domain-containing protein [Flavobacteriaceae bacterium R38]
MNTYKTNRTAVLIFVLSEEEEQRKKPFLRNNTLYHQLNNRVKKVVEKTGLDYFFFNEDHHIGVGFGERFSNAIETVYEKGYDTVITIGNDSPGLNANHILKTQEALQKDHFVMGPAYDGGFYLMGLHKTYFNKAKFQSFSWNTSKVSSQIVEYIKQLTGAILILNYLFDIDNVSDLKKVYKTLSLSLRLLRAIIQKLIQSIQFSLEKLHWFVFDIVLKVFYNKGSPSISL